MIKEGWVLGRDKNAMWLKKEDQEVVFDIIIPMSEGILFVMYMKCNIDSEVAGASAATNKKIVLIKKVHEWLGHSNEDATHETAKQLGWQLSRGELGVCDACTKAKAKQKNLHTKMAEEMTNKAMKPNQHMYLDLATIKSPKSMPNVPLKVWHIIMDELMGLKFSNFFKTKAAMVEPTCELLNKWKMNKMPVKIIWMDNAGENNKLKERSESANWKLGIDFEFTARVTPQQNHLAEIGFAVIANKGHALFASVNVPLKLRYKLVNEAFKMAMLLNGLVVVEINGKKATRFEHWYGKNPAFVNHL